MAVRINNEGYFLDVNGKVKDYNQKDHLAWKAKLDAAWAESHKGQSAPPSDQTVMVVEKGDCQWTIAEDAGADPVKTAYSINKQFDNPDLIHPGEIVFVDKTTQYAHTDGADAHDNADIFADQTFDHTATASTSDGNFDSVRADASAYLDSIPSLQEDSFLHYQALDNVLQGPSWGGNTDEGHYGRQIVLEEYFKKFPEKATGDGQIDRQTAENELKVHFGLATKNADGTYTDKKDGLSDDQKSLLQDINNAAVTVTPKH